MAWKYVNAFDRHGSIIIESFFWENVKIWLLDGVWRINDAICIVENGWTQE